ncbi:MAG: hypothetical protein V3T88_08945 [Nitrosomonadaceae bacterium]
MDLYDKATAVFDKTTCEDSGEIADITGMAAEALAGLRLLYLNTNAQDEIEAAQAHLWKAIKLLKMK